MRTYLFILIVLFAVISCNNDKEKISSQSKKAAQVPEAIAFNGDSLFQIPVDSAVLAKYTVLIEKYLKEENLTEEDYINWGNAYASIYQFNNAIKVYNDGLSHSPDSYKLLRYRAHRQLSIRKVNEAIDDLHKALTYLNNTDSVELEYQPDGTVSGSYEYWIYYHLGLANLLNGNYDEAISAYKNCILTSVTGVNKAGATYWLYNSFQKAGEVQNAEELINNFVFDEGTDMMHSYSVRILMLQGKKAPEELLDMEAKQNAQEWGKKEVSVAYEVANWYIRHNQVEKGMAIHRKTLQSPHWSAWTYLVTEKEFLLSQLEKMDESI